MAGIHQMLLAARRVIVALAGATVFNSVIDPTDAIAEYELNSDGGIYKTVRVTRTNIGTWLVKGLNSQCEVQATLTSGTLTSGTTGSFLPLSITRKWRVEQTSFGNKQCAFNLEIRNANTLASLVSSVAIQLEANVDV